MTGPSEIDESAREAEAELNRERRKVDVDTNNFSIRELLRMMNEGELNIAPAYQRKFRWSVETESALIESVLLGLPVPSIFVATNEGFQWEVVDGLQRLSTMLHFLEPSDSALERIERKEALTLTGLTKLNSLNGKKFVDIPRSLQIYFGRQPLQVTALTDKSDSGIRYDLFERLNRGAVALSEQEVRACLFRGPFNEMLEVIAAMPSYRQIVLVSDEKTNDGTLEEVVLKYFAYSLRRTSFNGRIKQFLNEFMNESKTSFDTEKGKNEFEAVINELHRVLNGKPYKRSNYGVTPLVQLEASLVAIGDILREGGTVGTPTADWVDDQELMQASMGGTNSRSMLLKRIERAKVLLSQ
jgi:Protein of unknown function DUF262